MNVKQTKFEYAGLDRPRYFRATHFEYTTVSGHTEPALLVEANGVVILQTGWQERYTIQPVCTEDGGNYVSFVEVGTDSPPEQEVIAFEARAETWAADLRTVVEQLVNRVVHAKTRTSGRKRVITEDSERAITEHLYEAFLCQACYVNSTGFQEEIELLERQRAVTGR